MIRAISSSVYPGGTYSELLPNNLFHHPATILPSRLVYKLATIPRWIINQPGGTQPRQPYYWSRGLDGGGSGPGYPAPPPVLAAPNCGTNHWWPWFLLG
ncbi:MULTISPECIES: hypothetical protein [unclassified Nocardia]|uniref:hypothetical protein n=1 Tax=unclassified Nocardia TaxID=2637762 RepID=UPI001CE3EAC2|nr:MULTISPECIES: hypothetical protein [unclassified Nocardia]